MIPEQIKQTVVEIREAEKKAFYTETGGNQFMNARDAAVQLLKITDHLQKTIEAQAKTITTNAKYAIELQGKISEQAAEIQRLKRSIKDIDPEREP